MRMHDYYELEVAPLSRKTQRPPPRSGVYLDELETMHPAVRSGVLRPGHMYVHPPAPPGHTYLPHAAMRDAAVLSLCVCLLKLRGPEAPVPSALVSPRGSRSRLNWCLLVAVRPRAIRAGSPAEAAGAERSPSSAAICVCLGPHVTGTFPLPANCSTIVGKRK